MLTIEEADYAAESHVNRCGEASGRNEEEEDLDNVEWEGIRVMALVDTSTVANYFYYRGR